MELPGARTSRQLYCWTATAGCTNVVSDNPATTVYPLGVASKFPWDAQLDVAGNNLGTMQTTGQQRRRRPALERRSRRVTATRCSSGRRARPRDYRPAFTDAWFDVGLQSGPRQRPGRQPAANDIEAATVNLFVGHNVMHDYSYYLGFDEGHWNAQQYNNGVTTVDPIAAAGRPGRCSRSRNDGLIGNAQAGARDRQPRQREHGHRCRRHPCVETNMFLWQSLAGRCSTRRASTATTTSASSATSSAT